MPKQAARYYIGQPEKTGKTDYYKSPFRSEKTPSFAVSDKGLHDFGSGQHYDVIDFVGALYNMDPPEAAKKIAQDFHINIDVNPFDQLEHVSTVQVISGLKIWRNKAYDRLCALYRASQESKKFLPDSVGFFVACEIEGRLEYLIDTLTYGNELDWLAVYRSIGEGWGL